MQRKKVLHSDFFFKVCCKSRFFFLHKFEKFAFFFRAFNCLQRKEISLSLSDVQCNLSAWKSLERHSLFCSRCGFNDALMPYVKSHHLLWRVAFLLKVASPGNESCYRASHTTHTAPEWSQHTSQLLHTYTEAEAISTTLSLRKMLYIFIQYEGDNFY